MGRARGEPCPTPGQISWAPVGARNVVDGLRTSFVAAPWSPFLPLLVAGPSVRLRGARRRGAGRCLELIPRRRGRYARSSSPAIGPTQHIGPTRSHSPWAEVPARRASARSQGRRASPAPRRTRGGAGVHRRGAGRCPELIPRRRGRAKSLGGGGRGAGICPELVPRHWANPQSDAAHRSHPRPHVLDGRRGAGAGVETDMPELSPRRQGRAKSAGGGGRGDGICPSSAPALVPTPRATPVRLRVSYPAPSPLFPVVRAGEGR